jgi:hypothetical protein
MISLVVQPPWLRVKSKPIVDIRSVLHQSVEVDELLGLGAGIVWIVVVVLVISSIQP